MASLLLVLSAGEPAAQGQILDAPRAAGTVGERYDGYAVVREQSQAAKLGPLVAQINDERRKVYAERAAKEGISVEQVGRVYAGQIFRNAPAGTWFLQESGQWVRK